MSASSIAQANFAALQTTLIDYQRASGKTWPEVLKKKGPQLGYQLREEFRALMPAKGRVRAERLAALKAGEGIRVRPSVYASIAKKYGALPVAEGVMRWRSKGGKLRGTTGTGLNLQALAVKAELGVRESGRGFLGQSARFVGGENDKKAISRYSQLLALAGFRIVTDGPEYRLEWSGLSEQSKAALQGIHRARGMAAVARAISAVTDDMIPYIERKHAEALRALGIRAT